MNNYERQYCSAILAIVLMTTSSHAADKKCQDRILVLQGVGFIKNYSAEPSGVQIVVSEPEWMRADFSLKQRIGADFTCGTLEPGQAYKAIYFRSNLTNKVIGKFVYDKLTIP